MSGTPPVRPCARVVLFDDAGRLLLFRYRDREALDPRHPDLVDYWCLPGGGIEHGETPEAAALREVEEETGLAGTALGPCLARREILFMQDGAPVLYDEHYFLGRIAGDAPALDMTRQEAFERSLQQDWRWWALDALCDCPEPILPFGIVDVAIAARRGMPDAPVWLERYGDGRVPSARRP